MSLVSSRLSCVPVQMIMNKPQENQLINPASGKSNSGLAGGFAKPTIEARKFKISKVQSALANSNGAREARMSKT